ncbi:MAG: Bis-ABC ATPase SCO6742 [uncultured Solirubrobacteraceae bacterium]|uniref:Bis-ABC ATPase SCO6742 n=1 Tax=uncultured Solirubrobacteraceae bacterium TaxID=1162706 RepID=A0A6J4S613_9ACTN|nr:MAG: Bis-ABC ATPase SCO6742 [uncultured Solirubrobacteraceae bacterium]
MVSSSGVLSARGVSKAHGARIVLDDVSVVVAPGDVLGVVGPNGAGKSTLLRILADVDAPDAGEVRLSDGTAGYLPQEPDRRPDEPLLSFLARRTGVGEASARLDTATGAMARGEAGADDAYAAALDRWLALGGADLEARAQATCRDLGLDPRVLEVDMAALSGGQAARASLAAILLSRFSFLLLDEPTNDLDFDGLDRLERFVRERPGGAAIVSHDRAFLEATVTRVLELDEVTHRAAEYGGGWAGYQELRATAARHAQSGYDAYSAERGRLEDRARRQRGWMETGVRNARRRSEPDRNVRAARAERSEKQAAKVRATEKALERLEPAEKPWRRWELELRFGGAERAGSVVARLDGAVVRRGAFVIGPLDLELGWGERVALAGPNGSGKSTLVQALLGRVPLAAGRRYLGPGVQVGELDQARDVLSTEGGLLAAFVTRTGLSAQDARSLLAKFGLGDDHVERPAASLSPGERTRATLASLMAVGVNFLVLDEPTNHLDLPAIEQLEVALGAFDGTLLVVTHDRRLLDAIELDRTITLS